MFFAKKLLQSDEVHFELAEWKISFSVQNFCEKYDHIRLFCQNQMTTETDVTVEHMFISYLINLTMNNARILNWWFPLRQ